MGQNGFDLPKHANNIDHNIFVECPKCNKRVFTNIKHELGIMGWTSVFICFWVTGCCCWIPCLLKDCKDKSHICPFC